MAEHRFEVNEFYDNGSWGYIVYDGSRLEFQLIDKARGFGSREEAHEEALKQLDHMYGNGNYEV